MATRILVASMSHLLKPRKKCKERYCVRFEAAISVPTSCTCHHGMSPRSSVTRKAGLNTVQEESAVERDTGRWRDSDNMAKVLYCTAVESKLTWVTMLR